MRGEKKGAVGYRNERRVGKKRYTKNNTMKDLIQYTVCLFRRKHYGI